MQKSPLKAIKAYCYECSGGQREEVKHCAVKNCELYAFRSGKNPYRKKRELSQEQKDAIRMRLSKKP